LVVKDYAEGMTREELEKAILLEEKQADL